MTCVTIKDIIKEVASKRGPLRSTSALNDSDGFDSQYQEVWKALNAYIDSVMSELKSLHVTNFSTVCSIVLMHANTILSLDGLMELNRTLKVATRARDGDPSFICRVHSLNRLVSIAKSSNTFSRVDQFWEQQHLRSLISLKLQPSSPMVSRRTMYLLACVTFCNASESTCASPRSQLIWTLILGGLHSPGIVVRRSDSIET
jgi:hypothetical protein